MTGEWKINVSTSSMPQQVATAITELNETTLGVKYTPIAYLGSQIVNGINHAVLVEQLVFTTKKFKNIAMLTFNEQPNTTQLTLLNVEVIVESGEILNEADI